MTHPTYDKSDPKAGEPVEWERPHTPITYEAWEQVDERTLRRMGVWPEFTPATTSSPTALLTLYVPCDSAKPAHWARSEPKSYRLLRVVGNMAIYREEK